MLHLLQLQILRFLKALRYSLLQLTTVLLPLISKQLKAVFLQVKLSW